MSSIIRAFPIVFPNILSALIGRGIEPLEYTLSRNPWRRFWMKLCAGHIYRMYRAGYERRTQEFLAAGGWRLMEVRFVWKDIIRLLVAERLR